MDAPTTEEMTAFRIKLKASHISEEYHPLIIEAAQKRYAWNSEMFYDWDDLSKLIRYANKLGGPCAWISKKGAVIPCRWGNHESVAETFLGNCVADVELKYARVAEHMEHIDLCTAFVNRPTKAMERAVFDFVQENNETYRHMKGAA